MILYHGKQDTAVLPQQARAFADSLESSGEYKVNFQIIEGVAHEIPWAHHRKIPCRPALESPPRLDRRR